MVSRITLGNAFDSGGRTIVGGSNTGFDTKALVDGLVKAKRQPAVRLEKTIELNSKKMAAYSEMRSIMQRFQDTADTLRNPPGVANDADNVFKYRQNKLSTNNGISAANYIEVTSSPGTELSTYSVEIGTLASFNIKTTNTFALANLDTAVVGATAPFQSGIISLGASGVSVSLSDGDTLRQVVEKINAVSDQSGVMATAIQVSAGNYRLQLKSTETGTNTNYATPNAAVFATGFAIEQNAVNATATVDGTLITSQTNTISNAVDGMTFTLLQPTSGAIINIDIQPDIEVVKSAILNFVDSYNQLKIFAAKQTEVDEQSGLAKETAVLNNSSVMRRAISDAVNQVSALVSGLSTPNSLADLGITFDDFAGDAETPYTRNILQVDEDKLDSMLESNFDAVRKIFEFDMSSTNPQVQVFNRTNGLSISNFNLNINITGGVYEATYLGPSGITTVSLTASDISGGGKLLTGQAGTVLEGLQLIYSGTTDTTSGISITQGLGDRMYNNLESTLDFTDGSLSIETESLSDAETRMQNEIRRIDELVESYRQQMLNKFAALEGLLSTVNSILSSIEANMNARNG